MLFAAICIHPVFAAEGQIGITSGYQVLWTSEEIIEGFSFDYEYRSAAVSLDGANYFGRNGGFGLEYGIGISNRLSMRIEDFKTDYEEFDPSLLLHAGAAFRHGFTDVIGIASSLGVSTEMYWDSVDDPGYEHKIFNLGLSVYARVSYDFTFSSIRLNLGLEMSRLFYTAAKTTIGDESYTVDGNVSGFHMTPYVSLSYKY